MHNGICWAAVPPWEVEGEGVRRLPYLAKWNNETGTCLLRGGGELKLVSGNYTETERKKSRPAALSARREGEEEEEEGEREC